MLLCALLLVRVGCWLGVRVVVCMGVGGEWRRVRSGGVVGEGMALRAQSLIR